jgi:hypothetical protein
MNEAKPEYPEFAPIGTEFIWSVLEDSWKSEPEDRLDACSVVERLDKVGEQLREDSYY